MRVDWRRECENPHEVERKLATLIVRLHDHARHVDGSGGDQGRDVELRTDDRLIFWESKAFPDRLSSGRKSQILKSLTTAAAHQPDEWWLVLPMLLTPDEIAWFDSLKAKKGFDFVAGYRDRTWIDTQLAGQEDLLRSFRSVQDELLTAAKEYAQEKAVLARGVEDLVDRADALSTRANDLSPDYALRTVTGNGGTAVEIVPKRPDVGPVFESLEFEFPEDNEDALALSDRLREVVDYGRPGEVRIPGDYIRKVEVVESAQALNLPIAPERLHALGISLEAESVNLPLTVAVYRPQSVFPVASNRFLLTRRGTGRSGFTLEGRDSAGTMTIRLTFRLGNPDSGSDQTPSLAVNIQETDPGAILPMNALPAMRLGVALRAPNVARLTAQGLDIGQVDELPIPDSTFRVRADRLLQATEDLAFIQAHLSQYFSLPPVFSAGDLRRLRNVRALLQGRTVAEWMRGSFDGPVSAESATDFLDQFPGPIFAFRATFETAIVQFGKDNVILGPIEYYSPEVRLQGKKAIRGLRPGDPAGKARFVPVNGWFQARLLINSEDQSATFGPAHQEPGEPQEL